MSLLKLFHNISRALQGNGANSLVFGTEYSVVDERKFLAAVCFPSDRETARAVLDHYKMAKEKSYLICTKGAHGKPVLTQDEDVMDIAGALAGGKDDVTDLMDRPIMLSAHALTLTPAQLGLALYKDAPDVVIQPPAPSGPGQHGGGGG